MEKLVEVREFIVHMSEGNAGWREDTEMSFVSTQEPECKRHFYTLQESSDCIL